MVVRLAQSGDPIHYLGPQNKRGENGIVQGAWGVLVPDPLASVGFDKQVEMLIEEYRVQVGGRAYPTCVGVGDARTRSSEAEGHDSY